MAHDFGIRNLDSNSEWTYFFGYCNGVMYKAFHKPQCDMIISGDNSFFRITEKDALASLKEAIDIFDRSYYPDPTRMDDIKAFYKRELQQYLKRNKRSFLSPCESENYKPMTYEIWFG